MLFGVIGCSKIESSAVVRILTPSWFDAIAGTMDLGSELVFNFFCVDGGTMVFATKVDFLETDMVGENGFYRVSTAGWAIDGLFGYLLRCAAC